MKRALNIGIDADGVIFDLFRFQIEKGKKHFKKTDEEINIDKYDIADIFNCSRTKRQLFWIKHIYEYCMYSPLMDAAVESMKKWRDEGHKLYNITSRVYVDNRTPLGAFFRYMIEKRYKKEGIVFDGIDYCSEKNSARDKTLACSKRQIDVMLEDKEDNIEAISKISKVLCFDAGYNQNCDVENMIRVSGFKESDEIIQQIAMSQEKELGDTQYVVDGKFKRVRAKDEAKLTRQQLIDYYKQRKQYYADQVNREQMEKHQRNFKMAYRVIIPAFKGYYNPQIINKELIPYQNGMIFVANHLDYKDQFVLLPALGNRPVHFLAASELLEMKRGLLYKNVGCVFVDRHSMRSKAESLETLTSIVANNGNIFIFPEGTRNRDPEKYMLDLLPGPVMIAQLTGAPIVPIAINNNYRFRSNDLLARIGEPFIVRPEDNLEEVNDKLKEILSTMIWENMEKEAEINKTLTLKR
jgi:1-acyl-sn-glycerol-3-phosphate acyltransferase